MTTPVPADGRGWVRLHITNKSTAEPLDLAATRRIFDDLSGLLTVSAMLAIQEDFSDIRLTNYAYPYLEPARDLSRQFKVTRLSLNSPMHSWLEASVVQVPAMIGTAILTVRQLMSLYDRFLGLRERHSDTQVKLASNRLIKEELDRMSRYQLSSQPELPPQLIDGRPYGPSSTELTIRAATRAFLRIENLEVEYDSATGHPNEPTQGGIG